MMAAKAANFGPDLLRYIEKSILIQTLDAVWKEHLHALDHLRQGIGLRAYGQRDPLTEYKSEAFVLFNAMLDELKERVSSVLARIELAPQEPQPIEQPALMPFLESHPAPESPFALDHGEGGVGVMSEPIALSGSSLEAVDPNDEATWRNVGRNAQCPCGSGKKFKHCHGRLG
jgi:preprotein translocase subunit SecA